MAGLQVRIGREMAKVFYYLTDKLGRAKTMGFLSRVRAYSCCRFP